MLRRLLLGLVKGSLVGGLLAHALVAGLSLVSLTGGLAYAAVVFAGVLTAFVAGRPIWAAGARIEVLLKAVAAAVLGSGLLFLMRRYLALEADLGVLGSGKLVELPYVLLPAITLLFSTFFEIDDGAARQADVDGESSAVSPRRRVTEPDLEQVHDEEASEVPRTRTERR